MEVRELKWSVCVGRLSFFSMDAPLVRTLADVSTIEPPEILLVQVRPTVPSFGFIPLIQRGMSFTIAVFGSSSPFSLGVSVGGGETS